MQKSTVGYLFAGFALTAAALPAAASEWRDYRGRPITSARFAGLYGQFGGRPVKPRSSMDELIAQRAAANHVPESLIRRVIARESGGNPRAVSAGNYGLMQIRLGTARAMGYGGSAEGLLDAGTNMTYAVRYLGGAYRAAGGNENRAIALYQSGYGGGSRSSSYSSAGWFDGGQSRYRAYHY
jgi:soluble lytic murein transglycosylase-like protein